MEEAAKAGQNEWVSKQDAAKTLGVNERQVEKRAQQGYLRKRFLPRQANEKTARVEYAREDVDALLCGKPNMWGEPVPEAVPEPVEKKIDNGLQTAFKQYARAGLPPITAEGAFAFPLIPEAHLASVNAQTDAWRGMAAHLAKLTELTSPPIRKAWLTFEEAVEHSGLTGPYLANLLHTSQVDNYGRGPKTWRVRRASLDAYGEAKP
jgi:hypothetical protein